MRFSMRELHFRIAMENNLLFSYSEHNFFSIETPFLILATV